MMITRTVSLPELLWTVGCTPGLIFLLRMLSKAFGDWRWIVANKYNGIREYAAINNVLIFSTMSMTQFVFVIIGIVAMLLPPADPNTISPLTFVLTGLFIFASASKSIMAAIIWTRYNNLITRIEDGRWNIVDKEIKSTK